MSAPEIRKIIIHREEIYHEGGPVAVRPLVRGAIIAAVRNPFAGRYESDLEPWMEELNPLGLMLAERLIKSLVDDPSHIQAYGKGALVGAAGEIEHGALWHAPGGYGMRQVLGGAKAIVPSAKKVGGIGARLDIPLAHINASYVRSHFDSIEIGFSDGPRADEILFVLAMTNGGRIHDRAGGLASADIKGEDGLR